MEHFNIITEEPEKPVETEVNEEQEKLQSTTKEVKGKCSKRKSMMVKGKPKTPKTTEAPNEVELPKRIGKKKTNPDYNYY